MSFPIGFLTKDSQDEYLHYLALDKKLREELVRAEWERKMFPKDYYPSAPFYLPITTTTTAPLYLPKETKMTEVKKGSTAFKSVYVPGHGDVKVTHNPTASNYSVDGLADSKGHRGVIPLNKEALKALHALIQDVLLEGV